MVIRLNVRLSGNVGAGNVEKWSIGLNYGGAVEVLSQAQAQSAADALATVLAPSPGPYGTLANGVGAQVNLSQVDVYSYGVAGPAVAHGVGVLGTPRGFTGAPTAPPQTTGCITLLTPLPGASYRGRVYWPQTAPALDTAFKSSTAKGLGAGMKTLNDAIETALNSLGPWVLGVYSPKLDVVTAVTAFRSGDVLDTQRRRRDSLPETFTTTVA